MSDIRSCELSTFLKTLGSISFEEKKAILEKSPYFLEIRDDDDLYTIMYSDLSPDQIQISFMRNCVGTVLRKCDDEIVGYGFDKTMPIVVDMIKDDTDINNRLQVLKDENLESTTISLYEEGIKITVYFHNEKWMISTNRIIDASKAFWGSAKSFKTQFLEACRFMNKDLYLQLVEHPDQGPLKSGLSYAFIMFSPDQRSIINHQTYGLLHAATTKVPSVVTEEHEIGVPKPQRVILSSIAEVQKLLSSFEYWMPGIIVDGMRRYKIWTEQYALIKNIAGNTPDIRRHYLNIRRDDALLKSFLKYYPGMREMSNEIENNFWKCAREMHRLYVAYFILHEPRNQMPKTAFVTLMQIHANYKQTRQKQTLQRVYAHINGLHTGLQYQLLSGQCQIEESNM